MPCYTFLHPPGHPLSRFPPLRRLVWRDARDTRCRLNLLAQPKPWAEAATLSRDRVETAAGAERPSDADLLARTAAGDRTAFRALHRRYEAYAFWLARRILAEPADAEDAVQEAWIKVFSRARGDLPADRVRAWLRTVVVRCCLDLHRGRRRRRGHESALPPQVAGASGSGLRVDLEQALVALPWELRVVVVLHDIEGLSHAEVGEVLLITDHASRSRLSRARRRLRARLGT